jgi:hypothetical protein
MTGEELVAAVQAIPGWAHRRVTVTTVSPESMPAEQLADSVNDQPDGDIEIRGGHDE